MPCFHSFGQGLKLFVENEVVVQTNRETGTLEVASTSKLIKQFQLTANNAYVWKRKSAYKFVTDCQCLFVGSNANEAV
jgi:hypothetical protein